MQLVLSSGGCRVENVADFSAPRISSGFYCVSVRCSGSVRLVLPVPCFPGGRISV